jgi:hypothetical protein
MPLALGSMLEIFAQKLFSEKLQEESYHSHGRKVGIIYATHYIVDTHMQSSTARETTGT